MCMWDEMGGSEAHEGDEANTQIADMRLSLTRKKEGSENQGGGEALSFSHQCWREGRFIILLYCAASSLCTALSRASP